MGKRDMKRPRTGLLVSLMVVVVCIVTVILFLYPAPEEYRSVSSPNGEYRMIIYRYPERVPLMPGQGSDARGFVRLYDRAGRKLNERRVEMVSIADHVEWFPNDVIIPGLLDWKLKSDNP